MKFTRCLVFCVCFFLIQGVPFCTSMLLPSLQNNLLLCRSTSLIQQTQHLGQLQIHLSFYWLPSWNFNSLDNSWNQTFLMFVKISIHIICFNFICYTTSIREPEFSSITIFLFTYLQRMLNIKILRIFFLASTIF